MVRPSSRRRRRPPGRPPVQEDPGTRDTLLEAASRLIARHGAEVPLRRVAAEAGVTPAMVHYYFGSKEGLYDALLERTLTRILERVGEVTGDGDDPAGEVDERLSKLLQVLVAAFAAEPWIPTLIVREVLSEGGRFRERFIRGYASRMAELLPGLMRREIEAGHLRDDLDPQLAFLSLMGMTVLPFVGRPVIEPVLGLAYDEPFLRRFAEHTRRMFLRGAAS